MKNLLKTLVIAAGLSALFAGNAVAGGNVAAGKALVEKYNCASCHGKDFNTPIDPSYPKLAGQHKDYLAHALNSYKRGADAANGRGNAIMGGQVKELNAQNIKDIAAYLHSLPGNMVVRR